MQIKNRQSLGKKLSDLFKKHLATVDQTSALVLFNRDLNQLLDDLLPRPKQARLQYSSILFTDLRGFTHMAEKYPPKLLLETLNRYLSVMIDIIEKHGGQIDKFIGDAIMVTFKAEKNQPDLTKVLSCAIEMQNAMTVVNAENQANGMENLYMGIGINTGDVLAGYVGSDKHFEYTVIGNEVNVASRVESFTLRGQILLSDETYHLCKDIVSVGQRHFVSPKGKTGSMYIHELLSLNHPAYLEVIQVNQRKSPRVDVNMTVHFQLVADKNISSQMHEGTVRNFSSAGMMISTELKLEAHREIRIQVALSLFSQETADIYAKVLHSHKAGDGQYETRLEFTVIDEKTAAALQAYVSSVV